MPPGHPGPIPRYRIIAGEAHSWGTLLLQDERGEYYLYSAHAGSLTPVTEETARDLLRARAYRPWRGDRSWRPLDQLPVIPARRAMPAPAREPLVSPFPDPLDTLAEGSDT